MKKQQYAVIGLGNVSITAIILNGDTILSPPSNQISSDRQKGKFVVICKCRIIK